MPLLLSVIAALGALGFAAGVIAAHCLRGELAAAHTTLSAYFSGPTRLLMFGAYLSLTVALLAVAALLASSPNNALRLLAALLSLLAALCLVPIALSTRSDLIAADLRSGLTVRVHRWTALLAFVSMVAAIVSDAASLATEPRLLLAMGVLSTTALVALLAMVLVRPGPYHGAWQKLLVSTIVAWIVLVSLVAGMGDR